MEHLTQAQIENYRRNPHIIIRSLSFSDHLGCCEFCRQRLEAAWNDDEEYHGLKCELLADIEEIFPSHDHLTFEEMAAMVDGRMISEELQVAKDHLSCCENCDLAFNDLLDFKEKAAPGFGQERRPSAPQNSGNSPGLRLSSFLSIRPKIPSLIFAPALAALLIAASGWLLWHKRNEFRQLTMLTTEAPGGSPGSSEPKGSPVVSPYKDGENLLEMDINGHLIGAENLPSNYRRIIEKALATREIEKSPLLSESSSTEDASRGQSGPKEEFSVSGPVGELILSDRPTFRWSHLDGATGYVVEVFDAKLNLEVISPQITENSWTITKPLKRGETYFWEVKAIKEGRSIVAPAAQSAKIRVLDEAMSDELMRARKLYGTSPLTMGLLYARAGLLNDAERELRDFKKANPDSEVASQLLSRIESMRKTQRL